MLLCSSDLGHCPTVFITPAVFVTACTNGSAISPGRNCKGSIGFASSPNCRTFRLATKPCNSVFSFLLKHCLFFFFFFFPLSLKPKLHIIFRFGSPFPSRRSSGLSQFQVLCQLRNLTLVDPVYLNSVIKLDWAKKELKD
ncbi:hypothetical protein V6N13_032903 [Hibiscus sabdariffa]